MPRTEQINITLGTAGHIDHGKTSLVKCLTGCDTDRLKEEKERGMSIELGFAPCVVGELQVGIVDVPGHENFIKTMVAGASGIDAVMLVVAADDGVMPQTREHMDILTLLGVRSGVIALTKIDRVDAEQVELVKAELRGYLADTFLANAPIAPVSNVTFDGLGDLHEALGAMVRATQPRRTDGVFRMPVERTFTAKGYGTVVCGIPVTGQAAVGDEVELLPHGVRGRVKTIQVYKRPGNVVLAGQCTAMNVPQLEHSAIERGHVVAAPGYFQPQKWCTGTLRLLAHEGATIKSGLRLKLHTGTSELLAAAYPLEAPTVEAGQEALVQFRLEEAVIAGPGDRYIVRSLSPVRTIGGGIVIDTMDQRLKRHRPEVIAELRARAAAVGEDRAFVECCVRWAANMVIGERALSVQVKLPASRVRTLAAELVREGKLLALGAAGWMHAETARTAGERLIAIVGEFHQTSPESPGLTAEELRTSSGFSKEVCDALVGQLKLQNRLVQRNQRLALPTHRETLAGPDQKLFESIDAMFRGRPFNPPDEAEVATTTRAAPADVRRVMKMLIEREHLVRAPEEEMYFHRDAVAKAKDILVGELKAAGKLESVRWKYLLNTSRKYALPLLDHFDRIGVTRRLNNTRYLRT